MINFLLGDSRFFWPENIKFFAHLPYVWDSSLNTGVGIPDANTLWITSFLNISASLSYLGISWEIINLFFWILPIPLIAFFSAFFLFMKLISKSLIHCFISGAIYSTNTYFLLIFLGGQAGVAYSYSLIPLVFLSFINLIKKPTLAAVVIFGLIFSVQVLFDPRFAFLTFLALYLYYVLRFKFEPKEIPYVLVLPLTIVLLVHSFWILPLVIFPTNLIPAGFDSVAGAKFFSFAFFENSLSLLHPNWPENIFGKTYFMRPEFIGLPILAFASLIFIKIRNKSFDGRIIIFFSLLALVSAFLGKGANEPFGGLFSFLFEHIPGFSIFRDPTKFYSLVSLSFAVLIPFTLIKLSEKFKSKFPQITAVLFIAFWLFSLRLIFAGEQNFFKIHKIPESYVQLKDFIVNQDKFFRTLWIPSWQRYGYFSDVNPAIGRGEIFKESSAAGMLRELNNKDSVKKLQNLSIKYVIVPEDSIGEIYLEDRKYSKKIYQQTLGETEKLSYLGEPVKFGEIAVFEVPNSKDRFYLNNVRATLTYKFINSTEYRVRLENIKSGDILVFSENFDKYWMIYNSKFKIHSSKLNGLNSFALPESGSYEIKVYYKPQKWVYVGLVISAVTITLSFVYLLRMKKK